MGVTGRKESRRRIVSSASGVVRARSEKRATFRETAARVDFIVSLMQRDEWRSELAEQLAAEWKVATSTVEHLAAEASRRVVWLASISNDPERLKVDVASVLVRSLHRAYEKGSHADVARVGDIVTRIVGARAPERIDLSVRQYEGLEPAQLRAKLLEQRARIDEALRRLEEDHPELAVEPTPALPAEPEREDAR